MDVTSEDERKHIPMPGASASASQQSQQSYEQSQQSYEQSAKPCQKALAFMFPPGSVPNCSDVIRSGWKLNFEGLDKCRRHYNPETLRNLDVNANFGRSGRSFTRAEAHFTLPPFTFWTRRMKIEEPKALRRGNANFGRKC